MHVFLYFLSSFVLSIVFHYVSFVHYFGIASVGCIVVMYVVVLFVRSFFRAFVMFCMSCFLYYFVQFVVYVFICFVIHFCMYVMVPLWFLSVARCFVHPLFLYFMYFAISVCSYLFIVSRYVCLFLFICSYVFIVVVHVFCIAPFRVR